MAGTKAGGVKSRESLLSSTTPEERQAWARKGGKAKVPKGFAKMDKELNAYYGRVGGMKSRKQSDG